MTTEHLRHAFSAASGFIPDAFQRGYHRGIQALSMTGLNARLAAGQSLDSPSIQKIIGEISIHEQAIAAHAAPDDVQRQMQNILMSDGIGQTAINIIKNPRAVFNTLGEALATELPSFAVAAGALIAGPAAPMAMTAGVTAVSTANAYGQEMLGYMRSHNYDLSDNTAISAALGNRYVMEEARNKALTRASIGAAFTLATMGASRIVSSIAGVAVRTAEDIGESLLMKTTIRSVGQTLQTLVLHNRMPTPGEYFLTQAAGTLNGKVRSLPAAIPVYGR